MPVTVNDTAKDPAANAYASVAEADTYFNVRLNSSSWTSLTDADTKARAIITATMQLEVEEYVGTKTTTTQALKWPRMDAFDADGNEYDNDVVPEVVKDAMFELALNLVANLGSDPLAPDFLLKLNSLSLPGGLNLDFRDPSRQADTLPPQVVRLLRHVRRGNSYVKRISRT